MRLVGFAAGVAAASPLSAQRTRSVEVVPGQITRVVSDTMGTPYPVPFPRAQAYRALRAVYDDLKIPAEVHDSVAGQVGSSPSIGAAISPGGRSPPG